MPRDLGPFFKPWVLTSDWLCSANNIGGLWKSSVEHVSHALEKRLQNTVYCTYIEQLSFCNHDLHSELESSTGPRNGPRPDRKSTYLVHTGRD